MGSGRMRGGGGNTGGHIGGGGRRGRKICSKWLTRKLGGGRWDDFFGGNYKTNLLLKVQAGTGKAEGNIELRRPMVEAFI